MEQCRFIVISGLIGVGKSRFTKSLADKLGFEPFYEPVDENPYLELFYKDPKKYAYPMQEWLKHRRFAAYQCAAWGIRSGRWNGVVMDRSIHEDSIFANINKDLGNIDHLDWDTYLQGFQDFQIFLPEPDVYVFLDAPPEVCCKRTRIRVESGDRNEEKCTQVSDTGEEVTGIPLDYMKRLHAGYQSWLAEIAPRIPVVRLDWTEFKDTDDAWSLVLNQIDKRSRFTRSLVV